MIGSNYSNPNNAQLSIGMGGTALYINAGDNYVNVTTKLNTPASNSTRAGLNIAPGSGPSAIINGDVWYQSAQAAIGATISNVPQTLVGALFAQTSSTTVTNTTTETAITGTGVGTLTLPASFFVVGKTLCIKGKGFHSSITGASNTLTIRVYIGSVVVMTGTVPASAATNVGVDLDAMITCRTTGASGTVMSQGYYSELSPTPSFHPLYASGGAASTTTVNTTLSGAVRVTAQWGNASASNSITLTNFTVKVIE
jgi:hypothetical protein